jgi:hypothetical protein
LPLLIENPKRPGAWTAGADVSIRHPILLQQLFLRKARRMLRHPNRQRHVCLRRSLRRPRRCRRLRPSPGTGEGLRSRGQGEGATAADAHHRSPSPHRLPPTSIPRGTPFAGASRDLSCEYS